MEDEHRLPPPRRLPPIPADKLHRVSHSFANKKKPSQFSSEKSKCRSTGAEKFR